MRGLSGLALAALVAASAAVYHPAFHGHYVSDDLNAIASNELVTGHAGAVEIFTTNSWWGLARADAPGYRPLTTWTFALNHRAAGDDVRAWHAVNFVLHGVASWLVFLLALELGLRRETAGWAGALFCVLSIHTEAVAWIVGRAELLAAIGYATSLLCVLRYRRGAANVYVLGAAVAFALGTFAKESAATVLAVPVLAGVLLPSSTGRGRDLVSFVTLIVGLAVYAAVRGTAGGPGLAAGAGDLLDNPLAVLPTLTRWLGAISVLGRYIALIVWPSELSVDYSFDALGIGEGFLVDRYSVVALTALAGAIAVAWRGGATLRFSLLLAASSYVLVSNTVFPIGTVMAERLAYIPTIGLVLAAAAAFERWLRHPRARGLTLVVLTATMTAYAAVSMDRCYDWHDAVQLFESAVRSHPRSARARMELASAYGHAGRPEEAEREFATAIEILPSYAAAWYNLGNARARRGALDAAASAYRSAVEHAPRLVQAWYNLAVVEGMRGRTDDALNAFAAAAAISPDDVEAQLGVADAAQRAGRLETALAAYQRAIEIGGPTRAIAVAGTIACLEQLGRGADAARLREAERNRQIANPPSGR